MTTGSDDLHVTPSILYREGRVTFEDIWTADRAMRNCIERARLVAPYDIAVLILGETGTGKNLLAQAIHNASPRRTQPFVPVDVGAMPGTLVEDALFGHEKWAFTGAMEARQGFFELAHRGTLFLDEIGNLSAESQEKILTAVESKRIWRLGSERATDCDVRVISATNSDLKSAIEAGSFRRDLYHRIARLEFRIPPLRERVEDVELLATRFRERASIEFGRNVKRIARDCLARMLDYPWPGNVRELRAKVDAAMVVCAGDELQASDVFPELADEASHVTQPGMELALETMERRHILNVLKTTGWNITRAAELLHIARPTLYEKIRKYGIEHPTQVP